MGLEPEIRTYSWSRNQRLKKAPDPGSASLLINRTLKSTGSRIRIRITAFCSHALRSTCSYRLPKLYALRCSMCRAWVRRPDGPHSWTASQRSWRRVEPRLSTTITSSSPRRSSTSWVGRQSILDPDSPLFHFWIRILSGSVIDRVQITFYFAILSNKEVQNKCWAVVIENIVECDFHGSRIA